MKRFIINIILISCIFLVMMMCYNVNVSGCEIDLYSALRGIREDMEKTINNNPIFNVTQYEPQIRRNIFRNIKLTKDAGYIAEKLIKRSQRLINKKKSRFKGQYSVNTLNQAEEGLKFAIEAYNNKAFYQARIMAEKSIDNTLSAGPFIEGYPNTIEIEYIKYNMKNGQKNATLIITNNITDTERKIYLHTNEVFLEPLPDSILRKDEINKLPLIEYRIDDITPEYIKISESRILIPFSENVKEFQSNNYNHFPEKTIVHIINNKAINEDEINSEIIIKENKIIYNKLNMLAIPKQK